MTEKIYNTIMEKGLYNVCVDAVLYYDASKSTIVVVAYGDNCDTDELIELPYLEVCNRLAWRYFWAALTDKQREIADQRTTKHMTRDYLHKTGLISVFEEALKRATIHVYTKWEKDYNISVDWENVEL